MPREGLLERTIGWLAISLCFLPLAVPLLFATGGAYVWDQDNYHVPAILRIRAHFPSIDLDADVLSAVAPGYHWFLAGVSLLAGTNLTVLRAINLAVSFLVLAVLYRWVRAYLNPLDSAILLSPLATSNFFVKSSAWVVTDNASILLSAMVLIGVLGPRGQCRVGLLGLVAAAAVFVRQINAWLVGPLLMRWYQGVRDQSASDSRAGALVAVVCVLSPMLVLGWLLASWHGLVPPRWQEASFAFSFSGIAYLAVVVLLFALFLFGPKQLAREIHSLDRATLLAALGIGLLFAIVSPTTYSYADGRWGGYLWVIVERVPSVWDRSLFFLIVSPLGSVAAVGVWQCLRVRVGSDVANLWLVALICWAATFLVNRQVFHRYFEPMVLVFLVTAAALTASGTMGRAQRSRLAALAVIQAGATLATAWSKSF